MSMAAEEPGGLYQEAAGQKASAEREMPSGPGFIGSAYISIRIQSQPGWARRNRQVHLARTGVLEEVGWELPGPLGG